MNRIGFVTSKKENEKRRALMPEELSLIKYPEMLVFEQGYWDSFGIADSDINMSGIRFAPREEVLSQDIICDPKTGDAEYLSTLNGQTVFGWIHAVQNRDITDKLLERKLTAFAWEDMFECGRHVFWRNNEIAGEAAIMHAFQCYGDMPYNAKVAIIGMGNTARGALKTLTMLGADVTVYNRKTEHLLRKEFCNYDVVVNAVLWDTSRKDHILYTSDLKRMKPNSLIIDISCDRCGGIESSVPTTIDEPTYIVDGIVHYVVDHTPSLFYRLVSRELSKVMSPYINELITGDIGSVLENARIIDKGTIIDSRIIEFQGRK